MTQIKMTERKGPIKPSLDYNLKHRRFQYPTSGRPLRILKVIFEGLPVCLLPVAIESLE